MVYIGIDPGVSGGIAILDDDGSVIECVNMPDTPMEIFQFLMGYKDGSVCVLEDVGQGMPGQSSSSTARFARHNGHLEMALLALGIRTIKARPQKWEKTYSLGTSKNHEKSEWKGCLRPRHRRCSRSSERK